MIECLQSASLGGTQVLEIESTTLLLPSPFGFRAVLGALVLLCTWRNSIKASGYMLLELRKHLALPEKQQKLPEHRYCSCHIMLAGFRVH